MAQAIVGMAGLLVLMPTQANAFCSYRGEQYAETTIAQEFRDAPWVVRAEVLSAEDWHPHDDGDWGTVYRLRIVESYKGSLPLEFTFFTERNSGGFYMDLSVGTPDVGGQYLLFLVPNTRRYAGPADMRQALWVNYPCGQSKRWNEVTAEQARELEALAKRA